jgi:hypothetical protein
VVATDSDGQSSTNDIKVTVIDLNVAVVSTAVAKGADVEMREQNHAGYFAPYLTLRTDPLPSPTLTITNTSGSLTFSQAGNFKLQSQTNDVAAGIKIGDNN